MVQKQRVKNDLAHIFFRFDKALSKEHGAYVDFIRALRDAIFVFDQQDLDACMAVLREKYNMGEEQIENKLLYDFAWFLRRVKRKVPTPPELEARYLAVYNVFKDVVCTKSGKTLFGTKHGKSAHLSCLKHIRRNCLSDIPFVSYYYPIGEDSDGLTLYKCIRGTSALEGLHQKLRQLVHGFSTSPRFMKALVTVYLGRWNHRLEIEIRGMSKKYEATYDGELLDEEIEKMLRWRVQDVPPPYSEWVPASTFQSTGEIFGLIDPVSANVTSENEAEELLEEEANGVVHTLLELETGVTEEFALLNTLPESSRWLAQSFGRWRPFGPVRGDDEWEYFKRNIQQFQRGMGAAAVSEADNHSQILWSAYAAHWNDMVTSLGNNKPQFTYKTSSLLQEAYKRSQRRDRRYATILPLTAEIENLRELHTSSASNRRFADQFVASNHPTRARPEPRPEQTVQLTNAIADYNSGIEMLETDLEDPAERERRLMAGSLPRAKRKRRNAGLRCRMCGKDWNIGPWKELHRKNTASNSTVGVQNQWHGEGNQVWDNCRVPVEDREPNYPQLDTTKPLPRRRRR
jgi:hypothetical protein